MGARGAEVVAVRRLDPRHARDRDALAAQRLSAATYSISALQRFAACPYQFVLGAAYRLEPLDQPAPLQRLDPLTRGSIVHAMQAAFFRSAARQQGVASRPGSLTARAPTLEAVIERIARNTGDDSRPAIPRVWTDEIALIARDLRGWLTSAWRTRTRRVDAA